MENAYLFQINFGIRTHPGVTDEIDDPLFTFPLRHIEPGGQITRGRLGNVYSCDGLETYAISIFW
jgi:hypothetical protein